MTGWQWAGLAILLAFILGCLLLAGLVIASMNPPNRKLALKLIAVGAVLWLALMLVSGEIP